MLLLLLPLLQFDSAAAANQWSFNATHGPRMWPQLIPKWCSGRRQSPIHVSVANSSYDMSLMPLQIVVNSSRTNNFFLMNSGNGLDLLFNDSITIRMGNSPTSCYHLQSMHWHWGSVSSQGSEHWQEGRQYPMEGHFFMWDCRFYTKLADAANAIDGLAMVAVLYEESTSPTYGSGGASILSALQANPELKRCQANCPSGVFNNTMVQIPAFQLTDVLPKDLSSYYMYDGSITVPDCRENVRWIVYKDTVKVPTEFLNQFRMMKNIAGENLSNSFRILQELNPKMPVGPSRMLTRSFGASIPGPIPSAGAAMRTEVVAVGAAAVLAVIALLY